MTDLTLDTEEGREGQAYVPRNFPSVLADANWCGASFNRGLLRIHDAVSGPDSAEDIVKAFSGHVSPSADVIAFDWAGRQFVVDEKRGAQGQQFIVLAADPATGDIEEIADIDEFLFLLQVPEVTAVLQEDRFQQALLHHSRNSLHFDEVIAVKTPLFFGGDDTLANTEVQDLSVYWGINAQLIRTGRGGGTFAGFHPAE